MSNPHLLIVSYWFPPAIGAAAERMVGFAQYLAEQNWRVSVMCADHGPVPPIEGVTVLPIVDPLKRDGPAFADYDPRVRPPAWKSFARRFIFPDRFGKWRQAAEAQLTEQRDRLDVSIVLASFPPASVASLGVAAAQTLDVPLVLDFRDRWLGPGGYAPDNSKQRAKHEALERACVSAARGVVTVSDHMAQAVISEHNLPSQAVTVVANGYFPEADERHASSPGSEDNGAADVESPIQAAINPAKSTKDESQEITIAHVGTVIARNHPDRFFTLLQQIRQAATPELNGIRFEFVGNLSRTYVDDLELNTDVSTTGLVDRVTARNAMRDADALLLLVGDYVGKWGHNAKLFEYVQTGHPILCLEAIPKSNDGELLRQFVPDRSFFADFTDAQRFIAALHGLRAYLRERPTAALELGPGFRTYSRREQAKTLAEFLKLILKQ